MAWLGKNDDRIPTEQFAIMLGVVETPIVVTFNFAPGQQRAPANPREVGWIDAATSELTDVARQFDGWWYAVKRGSYTTGSGN